MVNAHKRRGKIKGEGCQVKKENSETIRERTEVKEKRGNKLREVGIRINRKK